MAPVVDGDHHVRQREVESADPALDFEARSPFRIVESEGAVTMELDIPHADKGDLDVFRIGHELYVRLGPYRRSFILPDALLRREVTRAKLEAATLRVTFTDPEDR